MHRRLARAALVLFLLLAARPVLAAEPAIERLTRVGRLWGEVRYLHPYLAYREEIDWDAALLAALPKVREAKTREEYAAAVGGMLAALNDPVTRLVDAPAPSPTAVPTGGPPALFQRLDDGVLVLDLPSFSRAATFRDLNEQSLRFQQELARSPGTAVVVDLRSGPEPSELASFILLDAVEQIGAALVSRPCRAPAARYLLHSGYRPQTGLDSGGYFSGFVHQAARTYAPSPGTAPRRAVFLTDPGTRSLPPVVLALQACGDGRIVSVGQLPEEAAVSSRRVDLGEGLTAQVRVSEIVPLPGWPGLRADLELPAGQAPDAALQAAVAEARRTAPAAGTGSPAPAPPLPDAVFRPDEPYAGMLEPDLPHRQLAVIRAWNVIHFFYPYLHLIGDWDAVLPELLARMETAATSRDYALAVAEMMARVPDGHTRVTGRHPELNRYYGEVGLPLQVRWIEGAPVVTVVRDDARRLGIEVGDAILAVDGEPVAARLERLGRYVTASTRPALLGRLSSMMVRGPDGSTATLSLQGLDGTTREVKLTRDRRTYYFNPPPSGDTVQILPGNLGYVDLTRLTPPEVDGMFERLRDTRAIIFDMRGYPNGTAWPIAPRLNTRDTRHGATFRRALVSAFDDEEAEGAYTFAQPLPKAPRGLPLYTRPTVMLIDERTISQSEHTGLFFEAANGTRFIGTTSAGANGDVTSFTLPGGIIVAFTGHDVRHADGRQLQRVGLIPHVEVAPTRKGLREGRDEVLERAVRFLEEELGGGER